MIKQLEKSLAERDLVQASVILDKLYKTWSTLEDEEQARINDLEAMYLTMVKADIQAQKDAQEGAVL